MGDNGDNAMGMPNVKALHNAKHSHTVSWAITGGSLREIFQKKERNRDWELPKENGNHEVRVKNYWQSSIKALSRVFSDSELSFHFCQKRKFTCSLQKL